MEARKKDAAQEPLARVLWLLTRVRCQVRFEYLPGTLRPGSRVSKGGLEWGALGGLSTAWLQNTRELWPKAKQKLYEYLSTRT